MPRTNKRTNSAADEAIRFDRVMGSKTLKPFVSSAEQVAGTHDLLTEILLRVPAEPLLKFKLVSKEWRPLISNPQFCFSHTRFHREANPLPTALLLENAEQGKARFQFVPLAGDGVLPCKDSFFDVEHVRITESCNRLLLCHYPFKIGRGNRRTGDDCFNGRHRFRYFICNPATKQFKTLPCPLDDHMKCVTEDKLEGANLAFDPLSSPHYKVLYITLSTGASSSSNIYIYSSETESWTQLKASISTVQIFGPGVYCNGSIHWDSYSMTSLYFHVESESFKEMPMPPISFPWQKVMCFGESQGRLHIVERSKVNTLEFVVWELAADYSEWFIRDQIDLHAKIIEFQGQFLSQGSKKRKFTKVSVLAIIWAGKEEGLALIASVNGKAVSFNLSTGKPNMLCDLEHRPRAKCTFYCKDFKCVQVTDVYQYFETLIRV